MKLELNYAGTSLTPTSTPSSRALSASASSFDLYWKHCSPPQCWSFHLLVFKWGKTECQSLDHGGVLIWVQWVLANLRSEHTAYFKCACNLAHSLT